MNKEQKLKKMELELYALGVTKRYAVRQLNMVKYDITQQQKIIEELKNGE